MKDYIFGSIVFTSRSSLGDPEDPEDFITKFSGKINVYDEILNKDVEVGQIRGSIVECAKCLNYDCSLLDLFDVSGEIDKYMAQVWDYRQRSSSSTFVPNTPNAMHSHNKPSPMGCPQLFKTCRNTHWKLSTWQSGQLRQS